MKKEILLKGFIFAIHVIIPFISLAQNDISPIFNAFKQGIVENDKRKAGNCASIAIIKAAIGTFGVEQVFDIDTISDKNYLITLKDKSKFEISNSEISYAGGKSKFIPGDTTQTEIMKIFNYAQFCFAVMCKKLQTMYEPNKDFEFVVNTLNGGYATKEIYQLLGLSVKNIGNNPSYDEIKKYKNLVLWNTAHAVYCDGTYYDEAFVKDVPIVKIEKLKDFHCSLTGWAINRCKPRGAYYIIN